MKKLLSIALVLMLALGCAVGCTTTEPDDTSTPTTDDPGDDPGTDIDASGLTIALSSQHLTNDFNRGILAGVTAMCNELGCRLITANAQGDSNQQVADIENFLTMEVDAVIIGGGEGPAFASIMQRMANEGIPCITVDITSEYSTCNVTSDNFNGGEQLGLYVTNKLAGVGNILALDTPGWHSLEIRLRMLDTVIMDYPNLNVVQTISIGTQDAVVNYYNEVKAYLQGNPDIDCIYCSWGLAAVGASQALRELGMQDEIFVVCTDADQVVLEEMRQADSPLTAVVGQYPDRLGSSAVTMAVAAALGQSIPREVYAPIILIEKTDPNAWFSAPAIMTPDEAWSVLYPDA
ncbi:MAG: sugar ABC transporter substrate-binding protein [Clostridia bacterium]|nr:sugar ABC transporter substrate-binding protein [Clostridia bacterium]